MSPVGLSLLLLQASLPMDEPDVSLPVPDIERMEGEWELVYIESSGRAFDPGLFPKHDVWVGDGRWTAFQRRVAVQSTIHVDRSARPRRLDFRQEMEGRVLTSLALYELDGDYLSICSGRTGKPRPTDLWDPPRGGGCLRIYRRREAAVAPLTGKPEEAVMPARKIARRAKGAENRAPK